VRPKNKGLENPAKIEPNPPQKLEKTNTESKGHNPRVDLCPLIEQKIKKFGVIFEKLGFGWVGDKMGILGIWVACGGWVRWRLAGGGVAVVGKVWVGGGWLDFGFKGGEGRRRDGVLCTAEGKKWGKGREK
jgi:hypothetical protein